MQVTRTRSRTRLQRRLARAYLCSCALPLWPVRKVASCLSPQFKVNVVSNAPHAKSSCKDSICRFNYLNNVVARFKRARPRRWRVCSAFVSPFRQMRLERAFSKRCRRDFKESTRLGARRRVEKTKQEEEKAFRNCKVHCF